MSKSNQEKNVTGLPYALGGTLVDFGMHSYTTPHILKLRQRLAAVRH